MTKMTRKEALEIAAAIVDEGEFARSNYTDEQQKQALQILDRMIEQIDKQAARPKTKTSARTQNEKYAVLFIAALKAAIPGYQVNATWIAEHVNGVMTSQRGTHVAKIAIEWGAVQEVKIKKRTYYEFVPEWNGCEEFAEVARKMR